VYIACLLTRNLTRRIKTTAASSYTHNMSENDKVAYIPESVHSRQTGIRAPNYVIAQHQHQISPQPAPKT
jgi:hypothetical protein